MVIDLCCIFISIELNVFLGFNEGVIKLGQTQCMLKREMPVESLRSSPQHNAFTKPWRVIFDLNVTRQIPVGSWPWAEVLGLADEPDITVFSDVFDNDKTWRVCWVTHQYYTTTERLLLQGEYAWFVERHPDAVRAAIAAKSGGGRSVRVKFPESMPYKI